MTFQNGWFMVVPESDSAKKPEKMCWISARVSIPSPPFFHGTWTCHALDSILMMVTANLRNRLPGHFSRTPEEICVGNGSIEIIRVFCSVMLRGNKKFFTESHTFGEYALSARLAGACRTGTSREADVSFLCNPNNPTGTLRKKPEMIASS